MSYERMRQPWESHNTGNNNKLVAIATNYPQFKASVATINSTATRNRVVTNERQDET